MKKTIPLLVVFSAYCLASFAANEEDPWRRGAYPENNFIQKLWAQPFFDELPLPTFKQILDLGCGDGKLTLALASAASAAKVHGLDISKTQIATAKSRIDFGDDNRVSFSVGDAADFELDERFDLIFSNSAMHWVEDQDAVIRCASKHLEPGGTLYFLIPAKGNFFKQLADSRAHMIASPQFSSYLKNYRSRTFYHDMDGYLPRLINNGFTVEQISLTPRNNRFDSREQFTSWVGAWLFSLFSEIPESLHDDFLAEYIETYMAQPGVLDGDGRIHYYGYMLKVVATKADNP